MRKTLAYRSWHGMKTRCTNKNVSSYKYYGARGISFCERWNLYDNFLEDMGEAPEKTTLERIDSNKSYGPDNCRWATMKEQANNKSNNVFITFNGETKTIAQWSEVTGIKAPTLAYRARKGHQPGVILGFKKLVRENKSRRKVVTINGVTRTFLEWCALSGVKRTTAGERLRVYGWTLEKAFNINGGNSNEC